MGVCASVPDDPESAAMRNRTSFASKAKRLFLASPANGKALDGENRVAGSDCKSSEFVSKEEIFFETGAWFDSDCEDDFFSVKGEFTPSRGTTPVHPPSSPLAPTLDNQVLLDGPLDSKSEPSPTGRKKLSQLLHETLKSEQIKSPDAAAAEEKAATTDQSPNSLNSTPRRSGASSGSSAETTASTDELKSREEGGCRSENCCLPSLKIFGFDERSRQKMSPGTCATVV